MKRSFAVPAVLALVAFAVGCGSDNATSDSPAPITLVAYDSFPPEKTSLNTALDEFTKSTASP
jgi:ABC-type glycerol-3-phosphate transport system substrate-binding protein